jgi:hypothetical protein
MKTASDIRDHRLANQKIADHDLATPQAVVAHLGTMQAQEYALAKWAIGLRMLSATDHVVEHAFNAGKILRTHVLRPTWHFVSPSDIRWMLALTAPRVQAFNALYYRKAELDSNTLNSAANLLAKSLEGNKYLSRTQLQRELERPKIAADGLRLVLIMMYAELEGVICSGPRHGKQFTYALLDERAAPTKAKSRDEALAELATRYFTTRGPATIADFSWWSGLTIKDAKAGVVMIGNQLVSEIINGKEYFFGPSVVTKGRHWQTTFLMPDYDEYGISYKDRSALYREDAERPRTDNPEPGHMLVVDGLIAGKWRRTTKGKVTTAEAQPFGRLTKVQESAVNKAVKRFNDFMK